MRTHRALVLRSVCFLVVATAALSGCKTIGRKEASKASSEETLSPGYCAALRGNGDRINGLIHSLARVIEHYGFPEAVAGGSSASITAFLLESILRNPIVLASPTSADRAERAAFLLKSTWGYFEAVGKSEEGVALVGLSVLSTSEDPIADVRGILANSSLGDVVNTAELQRMIGDQQNPTEANRQHQKDLQDQIRNFGQFKTDNPKMFFQPGLVNFAKLARAFSRMGDFYAGRGSFFDEPAVGALIRGCISAAKDQAGNSKTWDAIKSLSFTKPDGSEGFCGAELGTMALAYRKEHMNKQADLGFLSRADEPIGAYLPAIISTSVVFDKEFIKQYKTSLENYWANRPLDFKPDFSKVRFGYWGSREDIEKIAKNEFEFKDEKTSRFESLLRGYPGRTWFEALRTSPAEPGLAAAQFIGGEEALSFGGWSDLQPVLALKNRGCENVVFITRKADEESTFARGVGKQLGMDSQVDQKLFANMPANLPPSGAQLSLNSSEGAWCTNWNDMKSLPSQPIATDAYEAVLVSRPSRDGTKFFELAPVAGLMSYGKVRDDAEANLAGCSKK